jgi:general stress protein 26
MENNFDNRATIQKLQDLTKNIRFCMFSTLKGVKMESKPMTTLDVDQSGNVWFFTDRNNSITEKEAERNAVLLNYSDLQNSTYVSISGTVIEVVDEERKTELWSPLFKAWFPNGKDDPNLMLIKVITEEASYWEGSSSKIVNLFSMIKGAITGEEPEIGSSGKLDLD